MIGTKEMFALDDGALAHCVEQVLLNNLGGKVLMHREESIFHSGRVVQMFEAQAENTLTEWSTGEHLIWSFCRSLAGGTGINLRLLAEAVGNGDEKLAGDLIACFALALSGGR